MEEREANPPVWRETLGNLEVAVWENRLPSGHVRHNVKFTRRYSNGDGQIKTTAGFRLEDLPNLERLAKMAFDWICTRRRQLKAEKSKEEVEE